MKNVTKLRAVKNHTPGKVRYFTYYLDFPDGDQWIDQVSFVHPLDFELKQTVFLKSPKMPGHIANDIIRVGESTWLDHNGLRHTIKVESMLRKRKWGVKRK